MARNKYLASLAAFVSLALGDIAHSATMFETMDEASRLAATYRAWAPSETVAVIASGVNLTIRVRVDGKTSDLGSTWGKRVCVNQSLARYLGMGGALSVWLEDATGKRVYEIGGFGPPFCRPFGIEIPKVDGANQGTSGSNQPVRSSGPMPAPSPSPR